MTRDYSYLYLNSLREAKRYNEVSKWVESHKQNVACRDAIEQAIRNGFDGLHLDRDCAKSVIEDYGFKRVGWVLSNTIQQKATMAASALITRPGPVRPSSRSATETTILWSEAIPPCWMGL